MQTGGKWHRQQISDEQYKRMFLVENARDYKIALAGKLFAHELGSTRSVDRQQQNGEQESRSDEESDGISKVASKNVNRADTDSRAESVIRPLKQQSHSLTKNPTSRTTIRKSAKEDADDKTNSVT